MNKFFDYLEMDLSLRDIRELLGYIRRFMAAVAGEIPVEGKLGRCKFCASPEGDRVRVHWVQVGRQRIPMDAVV